MRLSRVAAAVSAWLFSLPLFATISLSTTNRSGEAFDTIGSAAIATLPADFRVDKQSTVRTLGTYASAAAATERAGGPLLSTSASNGIYNFGSGTSTTTSVGGPDRAIGFLSSSGGTASGNLYARFVNTSGLPMSGVKLSYDVEKYRGGINPAGFRIQVFYSADGTVWTSAGPAFLTSFLADASNSGFTTVPSVTQSVTDQTIPLSVPNGGAIYVAWNYSVPTGTTTTNSQALAIDSISAIGIDGPAASGTATPSTVAAGGTAQLTIAAQGATTPSTVVADLTAIGGSASQAFDDNGDGTFSFAAIVANGTVVGAKALPVTVTDAQGRVAKTFVSVTVQQPPPPADHIVISQIYGGGGNSGAAFNRDFIELFNPGTVAIDVTGWTLQYASDNGTPFNLTVQPLAGTINPGEYYLIALGSNGPTGATLPAANTDGDTNLSATAGKVALVKSDAFLTLDCPVGDARIVDYVGYGSSATCHEGSRNAPSPSNSTALLRKNGGAFDTNDNFNDFVTGTPNPRRTATIVEVGPRVVNIDPLEANVGTNIGSPKDTSITVTFSEPVVVDANWFTLTCAASGSHVGVTTGSGKTWVAMPTVNFQPGEQCTFTVLANGVHDVDTDDSNPGTDTLARDTSWRFTIAALATPPYADGVHLTLGNPSNAIDSIASFNNYLMVKPEFALSYNRDAGRPNWVSWHLTDEWYGPVPRFDTFRPDPALPLDWYHVQATDFFGTGFDRGHMCPNADRDSQPATVAATFLMTNMIAQAPDNNQGPWANLENYLRTVAGPDTEIYIVSGPAGVGGTGSNGAAMTVANGHVTVPAYTWKVALVLSKMVGNDVARVNASTRAIAVIMPNVQGIRTTNANDWQAYLTTVRAVEQLTGYNFFSYVPQTIQNAIENGINGTNPPGASDQSVNVTEDLSETFNLDVAIPNNDPVTVQIRTAAQHGNVSVTGTSATYTPAPNYFGADSFTYQICDTLLPAGQKVPQCASATVNVMVIAVDDPPVVTVSTNPTAFEGSSVSATVSVTDVDDTAFTYSWSVTKNGAPYANGTSTSINFTPDDNGAYVVTVVVTDAGGATGTDSKTVNVANLAPVIATVTGPVAPLQVGTAATIQFSYSDAGSADTHTALLSWDDGSSSNGVCGAGACTASHTFTSAGVYGVTILLSDDDGGIAGAQFNYVIVFDRNGGSVTGGGWIMVNDAKVTFATNAKYVKNQSAPIGNTEVQAPNINFKATSIDWLVVAGTNAQYAGAGTINGSGAVRYVVTVADGAVDKFRIRIYDASGTLFDNVAGASDDIDSANPQPIGGGNITVH